jgi:RES domain
VVLFVGLEAKRLVDVGDVAGDRLGGEGEAFGDRDVAEEPIGAFVEKFGRLLRPGGVLPEPLVDTQQLSRLRPPKINVVDLSDPKVLGLIGLTAEIHATTGYCLTQSWASALRDAGYTGIRYKARHDPRGQLVSTLSSARTSHRGVPPGRRPLRFLATT